jgi:hypothetical protein
MRGNLRDFMLVDPGIFSLYHKVKVRAQLEKVPWGRLEFYIAPISIGGDDVKK